MHENLPPRGLGLWHWALEAAPSLTSCGCLLAWSLLRAENAGWTDDGKRLFYSIFEKVCKPHSFMSRRRGAVFPMRVGEMVRCLATLRECSLEELTDEQFHREWGEDCWLICFAMGLNGLDGELRPLSPGNWSAAEQRAATAMRQTIRRFLNLNVHLESQVSVLRQELREKRVGYCGEELGSVEQLSLAQVLPALPPKGHAGSIPVIDWVSAGTRELLLDPERLLVKDEGQEIPKLRAKIHCPESELLPLCLELVDRNICTWLPATEIAVFRGQQIRSGLFGVKKAGVLADGRAILRLIMNLVPSNSVMVGLKGSVKHLPSITSWLSVVAEEDEGLLMHQSDMTAAFYLFSLPPCWYKWLCFDVSFDGEQIGSELCFELRVDFLSQCDAGDSRTDTAQRRPGSPSPDCTWKKSPMSTG